MHLGRFYNEFPTGAGTAVYSERISPYPLELMSPEHVEYQLMTDPASRTFSPLAPPPVFQKDSWRAQDKTTDNLLWPFRILQDPVTKRVRVLTNRGAMWEMGGQVLHGLGEACATTSDCGEGACNVEGVCCNLNTCGSTLCTTCGGSTPGICHAVPTGQPEPNGKCGSGDCAGTCGVAQAKAVCVFNGAKACGPAPTCANGVVSAGGRCDTVTPFCIAPNQTGLACPLNASGLPVAGLDVTGKPCKMPDAPCSGGLGCAADAVSCKTHCDSRLDCKGVALTCGLLGTACVADSASLAASAMGVSPVEVKLPPYPTSQQVADMLIDAGYPTLDGGGVLINTLEFSGLAGVVDPARRTPADSYRACLHYIAACVTAAKDFDGCVAAASRCVSTTPWKGDPNGDDCCPEGCLAEYFVDRAASIDGPAALRRWRSSGCYPSEPTYYDGGLP